MAEVQSNTETLLQASRKVCLKWRLSACLIAVAKMQDKITI